MRFPCRATPTKSSMRFHQDSHRTAAARISARSPSAHPDGRGIRRPTRLGWLVAIAAVEEPIVHGVIEAYRAPGVTFLMPPVSSALNDDAVIDISHESLMRVWRRLRGWVEEEAQSGAFTAGYRNPPLSTGRARGPVPRSRPPDRALLREASGAQFAWADQYGGGFAEATAFLDTTSREAAGSREATNARPRPPCRELEQACIARRPNGPRRDGDLAARRLRSWQGRRSSPCSPPGHPSWLSTSGRDAVRADWPPKEKRAIRQRKRPSAEQRAAGGASAQETAAKEARQEAEVRAYTASLGGRGRRLAT